jgi:hypothetical protein
VLFASSTDGRDAGSPVRSLQRSPFDGRDGWRGDSWHIKTSVGGGFRAVSFSVGRRASGDTPVMVVCGRA